MAEPPKLKLAVVIGSIRPTRFGERPARWMLDLASKDDRFEVELLDLRDYRLPMFEEAMAPAYKPIVDHPATAWCADMARFDAYVVVTPEYNRAPPGGLKNALDFVYQEVGRKPISFVGYGGVGAARAIEHLRLIAVELQMAPSRYGVHLTMTEFLGLAREGKDFADFPALERQAGAVLDDLAWWGSVLRQAR